MDGNWISENLNLALSKWCETLNEIYGIITVSPVDFRGGEVYAVVKDVHGALQSIGYALLVLFFFVGVFRACTSFQDLKRFEHAIKLFVRFAAAKAVIDCSLELLEAMMDIAGGIVEKIMSASGMMEIEELTLPNTIIEAIDGCSFISSIPLWAVTLICIVAVYAVSFMLIMTVYGRFFKIFMFASVAPVPLSSFAGEGTSRIGIAFLKSYAAVLLEGAVMVLACVVFSAYASSAPDVKEGASALSMVWSYMTETILSMLILVGCIKLSDRLVHEMMGI